MDITPEFDVEITAMGCNDRAHMVRADAHGLACLFARGLGAGHPPAVVAGITVRRGDVIVADGGGVLCVPLLRRWHTLGHPHRDHGER